MLSAGGDAINLMLAVFLDELGEVFHGTGSGVLDRGVFGASGVKLDGGESGYGIRHIVRSSVDLGNGNLVGNVGIETCKLVILRSKTVPIWLDTW